FVLPRRQSARDVRKSNVGNTRIQYFHERGERYRERNEPEIVPRIPGKLGVHIFRDGLVAHYAAPPAFETRSLTLTLGTTDMPGLSWRSGSWPLSRRNLTGMR